MVRFLRHPTQRVGAGLIITSELAALYLERLKARRSPSEHTIRAYESDLRDFVTFLRPVDEERDPKETLLSYVRHLVGERGLAVRTARRRIACLRGFYADLERTSDGFQSPFPGIEIQLPRPKSLPRALAREDAAKLAKAAWHVCGGHDETDRDLPAAILLLLSVGLRVGELVQLKPLDFDREDGSLHVRGKGRRERRVPVVDRRLRSILGRLAETGSSTLFDNRGAAWTTQSFRQGLHRFSEAAGVSRKVTPHMLRHTSATLHLEDGVDLLFLQRLLGHENISTTALYAHVGDASLRRALERARLLSTLAA